MCDDGPCRDYAGEKEDVRATKEHVVKLELVVQAEDAAAAIRRVLDGITNADVVYVLAGEAEEDRW